MDLADNSPEAQSVLKVYEEMITNSEILAGGLKHLEDALNKIPNFAAISIKLYVAWGEKDKQTRVYIGAIFKNMMREFWDSNSAISSQKKALMIVNAMSFDGIDLWAPFLKQITEWMPSDDITIIDTGLELFCTIFARVTEKYRYDKVLPEKFSLAPIIPKLLLSLIQIFANPELSENQREKLLVLVYLAISSFAYADGQDNKLVANCFDETFKTWMSLFISALSTNPKKHITMKRYILKILNVIFRDFSIYSRDILSSRIQHIWKFFNTLIPLYVWNCVNGIPLTLLDNNLNPTQDPQEIMSQKKEVFDPYFNGMDSLDVKYLDQEDEFSTEIEGMILNSIELVSTVITKVQFYQLVKYAVFPIINALAHFILLSKEQEKLWLLDPKQFVSDEEDEINIKSQRRVVQNLILQLIENFGDQATQALIIIAEKFMMNNDEAHTSKIIQALYDKSQLSEHKVGDSLDFTKEKLMEFVKSSSFDCSISEITWKKREVGLQLLGKYQNDVIDFSCKNPSSFDFSSLIQNLIVDIESQNSKPILIAKSLWCVSRFSEIIATKNTNLFLHLFKITSACLSQQHLFPIRLIATKAIGIFATKIKKYEQYLSDKGTWEENKIENISILNDIFDILQCVNVDTVHIILDTLVSLNKLSKVYIPEVANLGARAILEIFTSQHEDRIISRIITSLITQLAEDPNSFSIIFQTAFSSFILSSFNLIYSQIQENSCLTQIKPQDLSMMANIFTITSIFVKNCHDNQAKENLITLLPPLLNIMVVSEENMLQQYASICLKNFITVANQFIIKNFLVQDVFQVIKKMLQVPTNSQLESSSTYAGNLCMIAFHKLLGGAADPEILKQVVYKIFRSKLATTIQGLVVVWARMIIQNPLESVNFLFNFNFDNKIALKALIDKWLFFQPIFRGKLTRMICYLALTKLFLLKDKRIENLIAIAFNPSHSNIGNDVSASFKIFSTLIRGLDNEMAPSRQDKDLNDDSTRLSLDKADDSTRQSSCKADDDNGDDADYERLEADDGNDDFNGNFKGENDDKIEVGLNVIQDDEENDIKKRFAVGEDKAGGLGEIEKSTTCFITLTDRLACGFEDGEECDETTEEDLAYLNDQFVHQSTAEMLKDFFKDLAKNDPKYLAECLKHLLKEDIALLQKYITIKKIEQLSTNSASTN